MFRSIPLGPQPTWKRPLYLALTTLLGLILSFGAHAMIEMWYLRWAETNHAIVVWTNALGSCSLPLWFQILLPILGLVGGYFQGRVWWRLVYVERRWEKRENKKLKEKD